MKNTLAQEILKLQEIPLPEGPQAKEPEDELSKIKKQIAEERRKYNQRIKKIYETKAEGGHFRKIVTLNMYGIRARRRDQFAVHQQLKTIFTEERAYAEEHRPKTRLECVNGERPCPWVTCRYHLALGVAENGSVQLNFPDPRPDSDLSEINYSDMMDTCALDAVDRSAPFPMTLEEIGLLLNISKSRVEQIIDEALQKLRNQCALDAGIPFSSPADSENGNKNDKSTADEFRGEATEQFDEKVFGDLKL